MLTFESFRPGQELGRCTFALEPALLALWRRLYPYDDCGDLMPPGMASVVTMRSYMKILVPRPEGNVHAGQRMRIHRLPQVGETLTTTIGCADKAMRKGRRFVTFATRTDDAGGATVLSGTTTSIWAA